MTDTAPTDDEILALAQKIKTESEGKSLADAMIVAEQRLTKSTIDAHFTLELELKPKVAKWVHQIFGNNENFRDGLNLTTEERLANFVAGELNKIRGKSLAHLRAAPPIGNAGKPVTMRHSAFLENTPDG